MVDLADGPCIVNHGPRLHLPEHPGTVQVVIPAHDSRATLGLCLSALRAAAEGIPIDAVVVHDGEGVEQLETLAEAWRLREIRSRGERNAAAARNTGAALATGGIIVFLDADVILETGSLRALLAPILRAEADAVTGSYSTCVDGLNFYQKYKQLYVSAVYARQPGELRNEFWSAFAAIRAHAFHFAGGFDEHFAGAAGEDTELGQRLTRHGFRIVCCPQASARHLHHYTFAKLVRNDFRKGRQSLLNGLCNRSLCDHRHSTRADMAGVFFACLALLAAGASAFLGKPLLGLPAPFAWAFFRRDLMKAWRSQGGAFLVRCLPLAWLLDLVRGLCVLTGGIAYLCSDRLWRNTPGIRGRRSFCCRRKSAA